MKKIYVFLFLLCLLTNENLKSQDQSPFITTWKTDVPDVPEIYGVWITTVFGQDYNFDVDWENDGIFDDLGVTFDIQHEYELPGTYTIAIRGKFPQIDFGATGDRLKLIRVDQWGDMKWKSMHKAFYKCSNLVECDTIPPDLSEVTDFSSMFELASNFNCEIGNWNVSSGQKMNFMFRRASSFNQDISDWDVSHVTNMSWMFSGASSFNKDIGNWNVSNVTDMSYMFASSLSFNQEVGNWDVGNVTSMKKMFEVCKSFNRDIGNWNVSSVSNMSYMFAGAENFNHSLGSWNVSSVTDMSSMFALAYSFNQDIGSWDVSSVTNMGTMFGSAEKFNYSLSNWDVSSVTNMRAMFSYTLDFNQDLSNWNISNVIGLGAMFSNTGSFDQNIGSWILSEDATFNTTDFNQLVGIFENSSISCENYSKTLIGWANNPNTPSDKDLGLLNNMEYGQSAKDSRDYLTNTLNWKLEGDVEGNCTVSSKNVDDSSSINLFPNPTTGIIHLSNEESFKVQIFDIKGELIFNGENINIIDITEFEQGIYIVQLKNGNLIKREKVIKL